MLCCTVPHNTITCFAMPWCIMLWHAMLHHAMLYHAMPCHSLSCHAIWCCTMLCHVLPSCALTLLLCQASEWRVPWPGSRLILQFRSAGTPSLVIFTAYLSLVLVLQMLCLTLQSHSLVSSKVLYSNKPVLAAFSLSVWEQMSWKRRKANMLFFMGN